MYTHGFHVAVDGPHVEVGFDVRTRERWLVNHDERGYAKAENLERNPEQMYGQLRSFWGIFAAAYTREALKREG